MRLLSKFALLWSILIFTVNYKPFIIFAIIVTLVGAMKALRNLWDLFSDKSLWIQKVEERFPTATHAFIDQITQWDGTSKADEVKKAINGLKLYESLFNFLADNNTLLSKWAFTISLVVSVPFYCYFGYLFSCAYFGVGKVQGLNFPWTSAILDSLYMPFAWTDLPKSLIIRFIGGLQAIFISAIGYAIFFRHLGDGLESVTSAATQLRGPFQDELLRDRLIRVEQMLSEKGLVVPTTTPTSDPSDIE